VLTFETHDHVHEVWIGCIKAKPQKNTEAKKKKMLSDEIKKYIYIYILKIALKLFFEST
jgi:hypothetical protein